jgi:hypothetical protein
MIWTYENALKKVDGLYLRRIDSDSFTPGSELPDDEDLVHSHSKQAGQPRQPPDASPSSLSRPLLSAIL